MKEGCSSLLRDSANYSDNQQNFPCMVQPQLSVFLSSGETSFLNSPWFHFFWFLFLRILESILVVLFVLGHWKNRVFIYDESVWFNAWATFSLTLIYRWWCYVFFFLVIIHLLEACSSWLQFHSCPLSRLSLHSCCFCLSLVQMLVNDWFHDFWLLVSCFRRMWICVLLILILNDYGQGQMLWRS